MSIQINIKIIFIQKHENNNKDDLHPVDDITTNMLTKDTQGEAETKSSDEIHIDNLLNMVQNEVRISKPNKSRVIEQYD